MSDNDNTGNKGVFGDNTNTPDNTDNLDKGLKTGDDNLSAFADQLADIKNAQGAPKYSTVSDALLALKSTQEHIKTLETENAEYRTNATSTTKIQEMIEGLKENNSTNSGIEQTSQYPQFDASQVKDTTLNTIREYEFQKSLEANQRDVGNKLSDKFGATKAKEVYEGKAKELGLSVNDLDNLAAKSPEAVLAYFSSSSSNDKGSVLNTASSVNTTAFINQQNSANKPNRFDNLMFGGKTSEITAAWREISEQVSKQYEIT